LANGMVMWRVEVYKSRTGDMPWSVGDVMGRS
jgi:hypothetical protein